MTFKMHLIARVPNEGARRLAWWLGIRTRSGLRDLMERAALTEVTVDRLLRGEVIPGAEMARAISVATAGVVLTPMWRSAPAGKWGDRPASGFGPGPMMLSRGHRAIIDDAGRGGSPAGSWARHLRQTGRAGQAGMQA